MRHDRLLLAASILAVALSQLSCLGQQQIRGQETRDLDRKLSTYAWIEKGDLITFIVGTRPARYREDSDYIPLEISVANTGLRRVTLSRESFTLLDSEGNRYPCAGPRELIDGYEFLDLDRAPTLAEMGGLVFDRYAAFTRYPSSFSPTRTAITGVVRDRMTLPKFGYLVDFLYFPRPRTGVLNQRFELFMDAPELPDPVFVKFEIR